jgi:hypothetical protein
MVERQKNNNGNWGIQPGNLFTTIENIPPPNAPGPTPPTTQASNANQQHQPRRHINPQPNANMQMPPLPPIQPNQNQLNNQQADQAQDIINHLDHQNGEEALPHHEHPAQQQADDNIIEEQLIQQEINNLQNRLLVLQNTNRDNADQPMTVAEDNNIFSMFTSDEMPNPMQQNTSTKPKVKIPDIVPRHKAEINSVGESHHIHMPIHTPSHIHHH